MPEPPEPARPPRGRLRIAAGPMPAFGLPPVRLGEMPLLGLTVLAVEDSRFACDALRLMCRRAGARLRRAETLAQARVHLRTYRPDVALVDLGLPDGRGESLIADLARAPGRPAVVLGMSGDEGGRQAAMAAGADGFVAKPPGNLAQFCRLLRDHLPDQVPALHLPPDLPARGDPLALQDDLARAARALAVAPGNDRLRFVAQFLRGVALQAGDADLGAACEAWQTPGAAERLALMVGARLKPGRAFRPG